MSIGDFLGGVGVGIGQHGWQLLKEQSDIRKAEALSKLRREEITLTQDRQDARTERSDQRADERVERSDENALARLAQSDATALARLRENNRFADERTRRQIEANEASAERDPRNFRQGVGPDGELVNYDVRKEGPVMTPGETAGEMRRRIRSEGGGRPRRPGDIRPDIEPRPVLPAPTATASPYSKEMNDAALLTKTLPDQFPTVADAIDFLNKSASNPERAVIDLIKALLSRKDSMGLGSEMTPEEARSLAIKWVYGTDAPEGGEGAPASEEDAFFGQFGG